MHDGMLPADFLGAAGIAVMPVGVPVREARAWLARWHAERGVLRARPLPTGEAARTQLADVAWLHSFLTRLAGHGFPAPRPLQAFAGESWAVARGQLWELVSYLPGRAIGWDTEPGLDQIGALLARYHTASRQVTVDRQRAGVIPLADVPALLLSPRLSTACPDPTQARLIRQLAERLEADLHNVAASPAGPIVIHGDFTTYNVLADGIPPRPVGVIDFERAHLESPVADIAYGLWRSGRPCQEASHLDLTRLSQFIRGYAATTALPPQAVQALPVYLYGRGLQMIAKGVRAGQAGTGQLAQVQWTIAHSTVIADTVAAELA